MKLLRRMLLIIVALFATLSLSAKEGMYLLSDINKLIADLKAEGIQLETDAIYNLGGTSLMHQVPQFGGGCSSEIISEKGLLLTNYHCAHSSIQSVTTLENDYLTYGFWAKSFDEELPIDGLSVKIPVSVTDVTDTIQKAIEGLTGDEIVSKRQKTIQHLVEEAKKQNPDLYVVLREMLGGTKYVLFVSKVYKDIRLVGVPPKDLGKFGGDRDNWTWPRHTADFSFLRIYADKEGNPAKYSKENIPLSTPNHIKISTKGVSENDFIFILGYPGSTNKFATSSEVKERKNIINTIRYNVRTEKLKVIENQMAINDANRIKYSAKAAGVSNYWKHAKAQSEAFERFNVIERKEAEEEDYRHWVREDMERELEFKGYLSRIIMALESREDLMKEYMLEREALYGIDFVHFLSNLNNTKYILNPDNKANLRKRAVKFFKNIDTETETQIVAAMLKIYFENTASDEMSDLEVLIEENYKNDYKAYADIIVGGSNLSKYETYREIVLDDPDTLAIQNDGLFQLVKQINTAFEKTVNNMKDVRKQFNEAQKMYEKGIAIKANKLLAPDANSTIRLSYGTVKGYEINGEKYKYYTTIDGVIQKYQMDKAYYKLPKKFRELYNEKDFGRYGTDKTLRVNFIAATHSTGGNSGSPVLNANGELVGLLFDGTSDGLLGDYYFDDSIVRSIMVDIRYVLWLTDKFGESEHIINELGL